MFEEERHGGSEGVEAVGGEGLEVVGAGRGTGPAVVGAAKDENDVGSGEVGCPGDEGAVGVVGVVVAVVGYGGAGEGVVLEECHVEVVGEDVPPYL